MPENRIESNAGNIMVMGLSLSLGLDLEQSLDFWIRAGPLDSRLAQDLRLIKDRENTEPRATK